MLKQLIIILGFIIVVQACTRLNTSNNSVLTSYEITELDSLVALTEKPIFIFLHTDWCKYCQNMKHTTLKDYEIRQILDEQYYFVSFNGEYPRNIIFNNQFYKPLRNGNRYSNHELASHLGSIDGTLAYPTIVILDKNGHRVSIKNHYMNKENLKKLLNAKT